MTKLNKNIDYDKWTSAKKCLSQEGILSVVMPCFHLSDTIHDNLHKVHKLLNGSIPFEIIAVDDGSNDGTAEAILSTAKELSSVVPLILDHNTGKGGALRRGASLCLGNHILLIDIKTNRNLLLFLQPQSINNRLRYLNPMTRLDAIILKNYFRHVLFIYY
jgi:glycosyltransferase involved in cell wall biosynthesis